MKNIFKKLLCVPAMLLLCTAAVYTFYGFLIPDTVSCFSGDDTPSYPCTTFEYDEQAFASVGTALSVGHGSYKLFGTLPVRKVTVNKLENIKAYVGGIPFGIKYSTGGACVVGFDDESTNPAFAAGLRLYDTLTEVNGKKISSAADVIDAISGGGELEITYLRGGRESKIKCRAAYSESEKRYSLGIYLKDSGAGIGTLTFVLEDGSFGGLGHGILDGDTGELVRISNGQVLGVAINGVKRGEKGAPGELKGYFNSSKIGSISKNTDCGIFGTLLGVPESISDKTYSLGLKSELKEGKATILCTTDTGEREEYSIEISGIKLNETGNKCFGIRITDEKLLSSTGGIVQGMSGSPIIQNGKLVGAVTHVLINNPAQGYGIFIENMISQMASDTGFQNKSAA